MWRLTDAQGAENKQGLRGQPSAIHLYHLLQDPGNAVEEVQKGAQNQTQGEGL